MTLVICENVGGADGRADGTVAVTVQAGGQNAEPRRPNAEESIVAVPRLGPRDVKQRAAWLSNRASVSTAAGLKPGPTFSEIAGGE